MLTPLQQRLLDAIGQLPEAAGFALAGGAALIVRGTVERRTHDLDFFIGHADVDADTIAAAGIDPGIRPEQLRVEDFARLARS